MRESHYWVKAGASSAPSEIVVVDTESWHGERTRVGEGELHRLRLGCAIAYRLERGKRSRFAECNFTDATKFWEFLEGRLSTHRPVWVVGHNLAYDLGILHGWRWLSGDAIEVDRSIVEGGILLISGTHNGRKFTLCDTFNWYKCSLESIAKANGLPKLEMPDQSADDWDWFAYCRRDVDATALGLDSLIAYIRENELGPFASTIASLAFSTYRSKFMKHKVLVHNYLEPLKIERDAYYGGLVETPILNKELSGPIYECDVVSMYPHVCCGMLPAVFKGKYNNPSPTDLDRKMKDYICIADVTLQTPKTTYPVRKKTRVYHCTGIYRTRVADAELRRAVNEGHVVKVHSLLCYTKQPLFREYMQHFAGEKAKYRKAENFAWEAISKYLMNSLYGKTGQMSPAWMTWNAHSLGMVEAQHGLPPGTLRHRYEKPPTLYQPEGMYINDEHKIVVPIRQYWGELEVMVRRGESRDSVPAIAACVTSAARVQLQDYHSTAGRGNWYYSDTDSIWVNQSGLDSLTEAGKIHPGELGFLDVKKPVDRLKVYGRKDYEYSNGAKIKGKRKTAKLLSPKEYMERMRERRPDDEPEDPGDSPCFAQLHFPSAKCQLADGPWGEVYVREAIKRLRRDVDWVHTSETGWTDHFNLPQDQDCLT